MEFIFKDTGRRSQLPLPVTPSSFEMTVGKKIETVSIQELGDVVLPGKRTLATIKIDCLLPANSYPFSGAMLDPYEYVERFTKWAQGKRAVRFIITGTPVNLRALVESIQYGERDGTGDVYATITLRQYEEPEAVETVQPPAASKPRAAGGGSGDKSIKVGPNDSTASILRAQYGKNMDLYKASAMGEKNIKNLEHLKEGITIKLPGVEKLVGIFDK